MKEMSLSSSERIKSLRDIEIDNFVGGKEDSKVLAFSPRIIIFQNFKANDTVTAKFSVINISKAPTFLNMMYKESSCFSVKPYGGQFLSRLAPGISVTFIVTFKPSQYVDYTDVITYYTDKHEYMLPLIGMGPRPLFNLPDEVIIPKTPLKTEQCHLFQIRNVGERAAGISLITRSPYTVQPKTVYLQPNEQTDVKVIFRTSYLGDSEGILNADLETGEHFRINLISSTHTVSIELEKQIVRFFDTYNTMVRQVTFKIINKSSHTLNYFCMKNESIRKDVEEKITLANVYYHLRESETEKCKKLVEFDVVSNNEHERIYTRIFYDEIQSLAADETFFYQNTHFSITPIQGHLWPNQGTEVTVTFAPKNVGEFESIAYLDIDGVTERVPLKLIGASLPPLIQLNIETLDMDTVYINKTYNYEVVAINKGHIDGVVVYKEVPALFGSIITCTPDRHCLAPRDERVFIISFCNSNQGPYFEEINFGILDTNVVLKHYLKGEVIYPSLMFSVPCLDFGMVSLGIPITLEFEVINESVVEVKGSVKISSDGPEISSTTLTDYAVSDIPKPTIPEWPREFEIVPDTVHIESESRVSLKVTLTANLIRANQTYLELEFYKSDSPPIVLPVTFNAMVPTLTQAPDIRLRACFLEYPYKYEVTIKANNFFGYFTVADPDEETTIQCDVTIKEGLIEPNSTICLPIIIYTNVLGVQELDVRLHLFGMSQSIVICHVMVCGVRPIITCSPTSLHWGQVKLLTTSQKSLMLCNDSPVFVNYKTYLINKDGRWHIEPNEGTLPPESETDLEVILYLIDADTYVNKIVIHLEKVKDIYIPISATGVGTSIVVGGSQEQILVGRHFTKLPFTFNVVMENKGTRLHALEWSEYFKQPKIKTPSTAFYKLEPKIFKMSAEEQVVLTVTGVVSKDTTIIEKWYLLGNVEGINKRELLLECDVIGEFVDPKIELSPTTLELRYDYGPYNEYYKLTDIVTIKNVSRLPLDLEISLKSPFAIVHKANTYKILPEEENLCCCIKYKDSDLNFSNISSNMTPEESKLFIDYLTLQPVEPLRASSLNLFQDIYKLKVVFNLTHVIEERLEDQEIMKIQVLLDTTKHTNLKSKVYTDSMRIRFKGHRNRDAMKLIGKINFPNLLITSPRLDFYCLLNGNIQSKTIRIHNVTPLLVCYKFIWKKCIICDIVMPELSHKEIELSSQYSTVQDLYSDPSELEILPSHLSGVIKAEKNNNYINMKHNSLYLEPQEEIEEIDVEEDLNSKTIKVINKTTPMIDIECQQEFEWKSKFLEPREQSKYLINKMFQLTPHRGILKPNEIQYIHVIFKPKHDINVKAILECNVLGGPSEAIIVSGLSANLRYSLNTQKLKFRIRSFHENAVEQLRITNTSLLPFEYTTYVDEPVLENKLEGQILEVVPFGKKLESRQTVDVNVVMKPGVIGYFKRIFLLEISYLPHIPIEVIGWGVIPQMYLSLDRPDILNLPISIGYEAISLLTADFLQLVNETRSKISSNSQSAPLFEKSFRDVSLQLDWHICSEWDEYPSVMDVDLAIERMLMVQHVKKKPEMLDQFISNPKLTHPIPGFSTISYVIDYGVIITGNTALCEAIVTNYGPITAKLYLSKGSVIPQWLSIKICGKLNPGEVGKMEVLFSPTSEHFPELEETVETSFSLEVPYGVTMPVLIRATCAVPFLVSNVSNIDFGSVECGDKVIHSIPLKNIGKTTCVWSVALKLKTNGPSPITVLDTSGKYESNEGDWLKISFKPTMEMLYEGLLIFRFHMNPNRMTIPVRGQGLCPHVHIIGPTIQFAPTLPYAETTDYYFGITNPCSFPVELIIAHSDMKWKEEEEIYTLLYKYYNKPDEILLPTVKPGVGIPYEIFQFYVTFRERVNKLIEAEKQAKAANLGAFRTTIVKKNKSPKTAHSLTKEKDNVETRKFKSEGEIVADEIKLLQEKNIDPVKEVLKVFEEGNDDSVNDRTRGIIIFIHASPCEEKQFQEIAYSIGKRLILPVVNFDIAVTHALCISECPAKESIINVIDEIYEIFGKSPSKMVSEDVNPEHVEECEGGSESVDEFDVLWKKLDVVINILSNPKAAKQSPKVPKKKSPTSSLGSQAGGASIFELDLLMELLTDYFKDDKFSRGFVVDTLTSIIIKSPALVLTTVLKCKNSIVNIHLLLCQSDFSRWAQSYEESQHQAELIDNIEPKEYSESEIEEIVENLEDMNDTEYENTDPEIKAIFVKYGLEDRRTKYFQKIRLMASEISSPFKGYSTKSLTAMDVSESKKKLTKKEEPIKEPVQKKAEQAKPGKPTSEYLLMNTKYNEYIKNTYDSLINIANNWIIEDCELGFPLLAFNGQILGAAQKKSKKKSDLQVQVSTVCDLTTERGFPLTFVTCPCLLYKEAVVNMLATSPVVKEALRDKEELNILDCPVDTKALTVLLPKLFPPLQHVHCLQWKYLDEPLIKKCECNQLTDLNLLDDSTQENVLQILSKWHCTCKKKLTSSQTSTSEIPSTSVERVTTLTTDDSDSSYPLPLHSVKSLCEHGTRLVLQPGDLVRCKYSFTPTLEGFFSLKRYVEVCGWPESRVAVSVSGICDLPRLDSRPKKMFDNFVRRRKEPNLYMLTFLDDLKVFEFGPIFIGVNRVYEEEYTINLRNASLITTDVKMQFLEDTSMFYFDQDFFSLEPGCRGKLKISAAPSQIGVYKNVLLFCIKDNPEIIKIEVSCSGVVPIIEILPLTKIIDYGKLLLYRRVDDRIIVKNDSILPVMWKIRNAEEFAEDFIISQISGVIPGQDNQVIPITYIACRVAVIQFKVLIVDIYDARGRGEPMVVDMFYISAECYDVLAECTYENPNENYLNYGNVKVNSRVSRELYLYNKGKYNIYFKLKKVKKFPHPSFLSSMEASQEYGLVPPSPKTIKVEFECFPTIALNLVNVPAYTCYLLDGNIDQVIVAKFPVCVSIASFYNTFTLFPMGELNFHIISVGSGVIREVIINNTSKCPITYEIVPPEKYIIDPEDVPAEKAKGKPDNKIKIPCLKCGNFTIYNEDNLLEPGTSRTIQIHFQATAASKFEETINFIASDTCPAEAHGVPLTLVGTGAMPFLDFWNLETTFREHLIVRNLMEYKIYESSPHCVLVEESVTLHFFCVNINTSHTATIDLYNNGLVPCVITMSLLHQSDLFHDIFSLDKNNTIIEPLMHKNLDIIFAPKELREYRAVLEIRLKLLYNHEQFFKVCLIGEGAVPRIEFLTPHLKQQKLGALQFPMTCLGSISHKSIVFKNISTSKSVVTCTVEHQNFYTTKKPIFWMNAADNSLHMLKSGSNRDNILNVATFVVKPEEICAVNIFFDPVKKNRTHCDIKISIADNPYEYFTILCEAEGFMEDIILQGLDMLPLHADIARSEERNSSSGSIKKKSKSAPADPKKTKLKKSTSSSKQSNVDSNSDEPAVLQYLLDFGGCELCSLQRRTVIMVNNSEKVYKFSWQELEYIIIKPSTGFILPGEEKDFEIIFYSSEPMTLRQEPFNCILFAMENESDKIDNKGTTWSNNQTITLYDDERCQRIYERYEEIVDSQGLNSQTSDNELFTNNIIILVSITTEYIKYTCDLNEDIKLQDTFVHKKRSFNFTLKNEGKVPMKISWTFQFDEGFPVRIDKIPSDDRVVEEDDEHKLTNTACTTQQQTPQTEFNNDEHPSMVTLFSGKSERDSVDTWFEVELPFSITPQKVYLKPNQSQIFKVTFSPLDAFNYIVRLKSCIDNLDPYDQNATAKITAKSVIPFCHLDIEDSDYITSGKRKQSEIALPPDLTILEFNVVGSGCFKKKVKVINPITESYDFVLEMVISETEIPELIPIHCNKLKGFIEGGTSTEIVFTFTPTTPGVYESIWKFMIPLHSLVINLLVVGIVKEPDVVFIPTILIMRNSLVGFPIKEVIHLKNSENEHLNYEFKGNSLCNESGKTPVIMQPASGVLKPCSETPIRIVYTAMNDGPSSFKIFCAIQNMSKYVTLCVQALSHIIKPVILYYLVGNEHILNSDALTNIHLDKTASTYERNVPFIIKNEGSAAFLYEWHYSTASIKKYMTVNVEPRTGHVPPASQVTCVLSFTVKRVPVRDYPVTLTISDGPEYNMYLHTEIEAPLYHFSCMEYDFGHCIINAPDLTYKKTIAFVNDDKIPLTFSLDFDNLPELLVHYHVDSTVDPETRMKIKIYFRPKLPKDYEFKLKCWVNSLCEEIVIIRGEGVPLLVDLYEGCQKNFDLGVVKVGEKVVRQIDLMNHSKVAIDATFVFRDMSKSNDEDVMASEDTSICLKPSISTVTAPEFGPSRVKMLHSYKDEKLKDQFSMDIQNALSSLKVTPDIAYIEPYRKCPLKIHFNPVGMISVLDVQLNLKVFDFERPLVRFRGSATAMSLCFSQNSLQFGRVRKQGRKALKVMLMNKGDFDTRFWWQPLSTNEFTILPMQGMIAAHTNVTFTITFKPIEHNPFIKAWASCNLENYKHLELAMYGTCVDTGIIQSRNMYFECPVRETHINYVSIDNPSDDAWYVASEFEESDPAFETMKEFRVEGNSTFNVPITFKPKTIGKHEGKILYSPLGENVLFVTLIGAAMHPNPNDIILINIPAKATHTQNLLVFNITEFPESYIVRTEIVKCVPDRFEGYYEIKHPDIIRVWGEAAATCRWTYACYEVCDMQVKVMFVNEETREYQFYDLLITVTPSEYADVITLISRAREVVQYNLTIRNPLSEDADFHMYCENVSCPESIKISRNSEGILLLTFSPLVVGATEELLVVSNPLIGSSFYKMVLKCLPAKEKDFEYKTPLGTAFPIRLRVENRTDVKADFICTVTNTCIITEKEYILAPLEKGKFNVWFEPTELGEQNSVISFNSAVAGEFVFKIKGIATIPKPQGPIEIRAGFSSFIKFKNVFEDNRMFRISVDREEFYVKTIYETIKPKKDCRILVFLSEQSKNDTMPTGTLTIETCESNEAKILWTYFLQGIP